MDWGAAVAPSGSATGASSGGVPGAVGAVEKSVVIPSGVPVGATGATAGSITPTGLGISGLSNSSIELGAISSGIPGVVDRSVSPSGGMSSPSPVLDGLGISGTPVGGPGLTNAVVPDNGIIPISTPGSDMNWSRAQDMLSIFAANNYEAFKKLDVAQDAIKRGKTDPQMDTKISTDDLNAALSQAGYLTEKETEAVNYLLKTNEWERITGTDTKATFTEIDQGLSLVYKASQLGISEEGSPKPIAIKDLKTAVDIYSSIPPVVNQAILDNGGKRYLIAGKLSDHPDLANIAGQETQSEGDGGRKFDDIEGATTEGNNYIALNPDKGGSGLHTLMILHEAAHAYDGTLGIQGSAGTTWKEIQANSQGEAFFNDPYRALGPGEAFADAFMYMQTGRADELPADVRAYFENLLASGTG